MGFWRRGMTIVAGIALGACAPLSPREAPPASAVYVLDEIGEVAPAEKPLCTVLTVNAVRSAPGYGSSRMVYTRDVHRLEYFGFHKWADSPASMVQTLLVDALEKSGRFSTVLTPAAPERSGIRLDAELRTLHQRFESDESRIVLAVRVRLFGNDRVIGSRLFAIEEAAGSGPETGVAAANRATARLTSELVAWIDQVLLPTQRRCE